MSERALSTGQMLARFGFIGVVMLAAALAFAYVGGWLTPTRLTPQRFITAMHAAAGGDNPGFRAAHSKGLCFIGSFSSSGAAAVFSKAAVFARGEVPLIGRFALASGMPFQIDVLSTARSMALRLMPPNAPEWRTGMNNLPVFIVDTPEAFYEQVKAGAPDPVTQKPDPNAMKEFIGRHPETAKAFDIIKAVPPSAGFADSTYNALNTFRFVDAAGTSVPVRWGAIPLQAAVVQANSPDDDSAKTNGQNHLFDDLIVQQHEKPLQWRLVVTLGEPGDPTAQSTLPWPESRKHVDAGTVSVKSFVSEDDGPCTDINFDPLTLPPGIEPSDDPLLSARSAVYMRSFTQRATHRAVKPPSAVSPAEVAREAKP